MSLGAVLVLLGLLVLPIVLAGAAASGALVPALVGGLLVGLSPAIHHGEKFHVS